MSDLTLIPGRFADVSTGSDVVVNTDIGLYIGGAGNVKVVGRDGVAATFAVSAGQYLSGRFIQIVSSGTTATGIVALYA